jgi:O-antigen/teichoic acid export membrane protein
LKFSKYLKSDFSKNILTLVTGTSIAQVFPIVISPLLTRIYTPEDFGVFGVFLSLTSILGVISTGRYEMAIIVSKNKNELKSLIKGVLKIILFTTLFFYLVIIFFQNQINKIFDLKIFLLYLIPLFILINSFYLVLTQILILHKEYKRLSYNKIIVSIINSSSQLALGLKNGNIYGLIFGKLIGVIVAIFILIKNKIINQYFDFKKNTTRKTLYRYRDFPKYNVPSVFINVIANQLPLLTLGKYFSMSVVGYYSHMYKVLMMPINLLSTSILDVFKQKATEEYNQYGNCKSIYLKTLKNLVVIGVIPFIILGLFSPQLFKFIYGKEWEIAGIYAQIMTPMFFLNFIVNPLSYILIVVEKQKINFYGQILLLIFTIISVVIGIFLKSDKITVLLFSISYSIIYLLYLILTFIYARKTHQIKT